MTHGPRLPASPPDLATWAGIELPPGGYWQLKDAARASVRRRSKVSFQLPLTPTDRQLQLILSTYGRTMRSPIFWGGGMGGGKSAGLCMLAIHLCRTVPRNRVLIARKEFSTLHASTIQELEEQLLLCPEAKHWPGKHEVHFPNGSELWYMGVGVPRQRQKLGSFQFGAILLDEATEIDRDVYKMLQTRLRWRPAAEAGRLVIVMTGNPHPGWIKEEFVTQRRPGYTFIPALAADNEHLIEGYIEDMQAEMDQDWYRAMILGDWEALSLADQVTPDALVTNAMRRALRPDNDNCWWAVDIGHSGKDKTWIARARGPVIDFLGHLDKATIPENTQFIMRHYDLSSIKPSAINVDANGIGAGVADELEVAQEMGTFPRHVQINRVISQESRRITGEGGIIFNNVRAQMAFTFTKKLQQGLLSLPKDDFELFSDLTTPQYSLNGHVVTIEPKEVTKRRLGHSPDKGDAVWMLMYDEKDGDVEIAGLSPEQEAWAEEHPDLEDEEIAALLQRQSGQNRFARALGYDPFAGSEPDDLGY